MATTSPYADLVARLDLRKKTRRRARIRRLLIALAALAVVGFALWAVFFSEWFTSHDIEVEGTSLLTPEQVAEAAQVPLDVPLARIPFGPIEQRILAIPEVADVTITRAWPHTVKIVVHERTMIYQRAWANAYQWVDEDGLVFLTRDAPVEGAIVVTSRKDDKQLLAEIATVVMALPGDISSNVSGIDVPTRDHIVISLNDGRTIIWGNAERSADKADLLAPLMAVEGSVYDVSVPSHPAVR